MTRADNTVTDAITGVTVSLVSAGSSNISVSHNTTAIKETILDFVDLYNETRDFIERTRSAKLDEDDQFGLFFSDSLLRSLFNDVRGLTTTGVKMGGSDWAGSTVVQTAGTAGDKTLAINGFTASSGTLQEGDQFTIAGDSTIYTVLNAATISGNAATVDLKPPLAASASLGASIDVVTRTLEDIGVGVRTDTVSGIEGILGVLDEGDLDSALASNIDLVRNIWRRNDTVDGSTGIARRLYDWIDDQTQISVSASTSRAIDDVKIPGIEDNSERLEEQISRLEDRMLKRETVLIRQFSEMENAMARSQSAGAALAGISGGGQQG